LAWTTVVPAMVVAGSTSNHLRSLQDGKIVGVSHFFLFLFYTDTD
jgi:hypothetical protein